MKFIDYYKVLGIERIASSEDIKRAYYKLARKYHPDNSSDLPNSLDKFLLIKQAYQVLSNLDSRIKYKMELENYELIKEQAKLEHKKRKNNEK